MSERIAILGAAGIVGQGIARQLVADGVSDLLLADAREEAVRALARELGTEAAAADVTDPARTARLLRDCHLTVNATLYYQNLAVMEACLAAESSYIDLGGLYTMTLRQLELAPRFEKSGLLGVLGAGKAPGMTNILAAHGATQFERLTTVHLRSGRKALEEGAPFSLPYSAQTLLDEFTLPPVVLTRGTLHEVPPRSGREQVVHASPFGAIDYVTTLHSELATLPAFLGRGLENLDFKVGLSQTTADALEHLARLGFGSSEPVIVSGSSVRPRELTAALLSRLPTTTGPERWITEVDLEGFSSGKPRRLVLRVTGNEHQNGTSLAAAAVAGLVRTGIARGDGVHAPESVIPTVPFIERLQSYGLRYSESNSV